MEKLTSAISMGGGVKIAVDEAYEKGFSAACDIMMKVMTDTNRAGAARLIANTIAMRENLKSKQDRKN